VKSQLQSETKIKVNTKTSSENSRLSIDEAREAPCMNCNSSPCCVHVPLHTFQIKSMVDVDHAMYMLNFDRIVLGISVTGDWSVYYRYPCRFLDRSDADNAICSIHNSPLQPQICVNYNPYNCWYKRALTGNATDEFILIDRQRMNAVAAELEFDETRLLSATPDWPVLELIAANNPITQDYGTPPQADPVFEQWLEETALGITSRAPKARRGYHDFADPCTGCAAHCCKTLVFPQARPTTRRSLDYLQFALGFPGIELGVADGDWMLVVKAQCNHLTEDNRCGIYESPERPAICRYYDASACSYVAQFGVPRPEGLLRVQLEQFFWMVESCAFDDEGNILSMPVVDDLREIVETRWIEELQAVELEENSGEEGVDEAKKSQSEELENG